MKKYLSTLSQMSLFQSLDEDGILAVINCLNGYKKDYEKNQIIYNFSDPIEYAGIVLKGEVDIVMQNFCGNEYGAKRFKQGDIFGIAYACLPWENSHIQVVVQERSKVLFLKLSNLFLPRSIACVYASQMTVNLLKELAKNTVFQDNKIQILIQKHIRDKLIVYICSRNLCDNTITLPFNRQDLADHLAVDRSALSRELGNMKRDGLIDFDKNKLYILNKDILYENRGNCI